MIFFVIQWKATVLRECSLALFLVCFYIGSNDIFLLIFVAGGPKVEDEDEPEPPEDFQYLDE